MVSSVYFVPHAEELRFKVGYSADPATRFVQIGQDKLDLSRAVFVNLSSDDQARKLETRLHQALAMYHIPECVDGDEWFRSEAWSTGLQTLERLRGEFSFGALVRPRFMSRQISSLSRPRMASNLLGVRMRPHPLDEGAVWTRQLQERIYESRAALARANGVSQSEVSKTLSVLGLPAEILNAAREVPYFNSLSNLYCLRQVFLKQGETAALALISQVAQGALSTRQIFRIQQTKVPGQKSSVSEEVELFGLQGNLHVTLSEGRLVLVLENGTHDELLGAAQAIQRTGQANSFTKPHVDSKEKDICV